jgi:predicted metal-dependent hydrolase
MISEDFLEQIEKLQKDLISVADQQLEKKEIFFSIKLRNASKTLEETKKILEIADKIEKKYKGFI